MNDIPIHLVPMDTALINDLCDRAEGLVATSSFTIWREIQGFRQSRAPWDAMRLANTLAIDWPDDPLVRELDHLAHERAGLVPRDGRPA